MSERNPLRRLNPDEIYARLVALGDEWAEQDAAANLYDETRKPLLARLGAVHIARNPSASQARADAVALASPEYREHVEKWVEARKAALRARVRYESGKIWASHVQSANANKRAELAMGHLAP